MTKADSPKSWSLDVVDIDPKTFDLLGEEPHRRRGNRLPQPAGNHDWDRLADAESAEVLGNIKQLLITEKADA